MCLGTIPVLNVFVIFTYHHWFGAVFLTSKLKNTECVTPVISKIICLNFKKTVLDINNHSCGSYKDAGMHDTEAMSENVQPYAKG